MKILIPTLLILIVACDNKPKTDTLTGDLYFSFFRLGSYYNKPDSLVKRFETYFDTLTFDKANDENKKLLTEYRKIKAEKLLYQPFVDIITEKDSVVTLYLDSADYNLIKKYKRKDLQGGHKKIRIEADVRKIDERLFYCTDLRKVEMIDGETFIKSNKFKIEDYN